MLGGARESVNLVQSFLLLGNNGEGAHSLGSSEAPGADAWFFLKGKDAAC